MTAERDGRRAHAQRHDRARAAPGNVKAATVDAAAYERHRERRECAARCAGFVATKAERGIVGEQNRDVAGLRIDVRDRCRIDASLPASRSCAMRARPVPETALQQRARRRRSAEEARYARDLPSPYRQLDERARQPARVHDRAASRSSHRQTRESPGWSSCRARKQARRPNDGRIGGEVRSREQRAVTANVVAEGARSARSAATPASRR